MELMGRKLRGDILWREEVDYLAELTEPATLGGVFDQDSKTSILLRGDLVTVIAHCVLLRNGAHFDEIRVVVDSRGRVGWLWKGETRQV